MKNITFRNLLGAFLGGTFGTLAFAYFKWKGLPFGCFFGVILGFWHREMWRLLNRSLRIQKRVRKPSVKPSIEDRMKRVQKTTGVIWCLIFFSIMAYIAKGMPQRAVGSKILTACACLYCLLGVSIPVFFQKSNKNFVENTQIYQSLGAFRYSLKLFANYLYFIVGALVAVCILVLGLGTIGFFTALIPWLFLQSCRIFWHMAMKAGHWPCFITTLATTAAIAFRYHPSAHHQAALWAAALLSGFISGAITLLFQRLIYRLHRFSDKEIRLSIEDIENDINTHSINWDNRKSDFFAWMDQLSQPFPAHL